MVFPEKWRKFEANDDQSNSTATTSIQALLWVRGMIMKTSSHYRSMACPSARKQGAEDSAGRNAVAQGKNPAGTQRISGPFRTSNNNSMSKAIKTTPTEATVRTPFATASTRIQGSLTRTRTRKVAGEGETECSNHKANEPSTWDEMLSARTKVFCMNPLTMRPFAGNLQQGLAFMAP